ncbi:hypothetical protein LCI18_005802 [Fusarium solani-melongenae]|uniref:Uncharacterized protein n=1 Tax=Fusarium solani subsp. cucurbitae TaxID=2747967 RepID=A0ACD3Z176_FUSSC|nr:hypothetical protein LCI18_005802 [Fusarium solani-melongenae]
MKLITVAAATVVFSTANALYIPNNHAQRYPPHRDDGGYYVKDPYYLPSDAKSDPIEVIKLGLMRPYRANPIVSRPKLIVETKTLPEHITPPEDKKNEPVPYVEGCTSAQYKSEESDHCVHYSHIEVHKAVPRSLEKRQKGPDPSKVDVDEPEDAIAPLLRPLDKVAQRYKPLIPKNLGIKRNGTNKNEVEKNERVIIYPKTQPKQNKHEFLEGLIGKIEQQTKGSDASVTENHGKEMTHGKDCDKQKNDELLEDVIANVEQRVKPQTPKFSQDKDKATEGADKELLEDLIEKVEERVKPQIPKEKGEVAKDKDEVLEDLLEQAKLQHKTRVPRWLGAPSPIESRLKKKKLERKKLRKVSLSSPGEGLRGYSPEYLSGLLRLEYDEQCKKHPKNCIEAKGSARQFTRQTLEGKARLEDMNKYAMMHTSPDDFRAQRFRTDETAEKVAELEFWNSGMRGVVHAIKKSPEEADKFQKDVEELGIRRDARDFSNGGTEHVKAPFWGIFWTSA